jgi:hypothetical protein
MTLRKDAAVQAIKTLARDVESAIARSQKRTDDMAKAAAAKVKDDAEKAPAKPAPPAPVMPKMGEFGQQLLACETRAEARRLLGFL